MNLQLHFRDRGKWLALPLGDDEFRRVRKHFLGGGELLHLQLHFLECTTRHGLSAWLNPGRLQAVRFLPEVRDRPQFDVTPQEFSQLDGDMDPCDAHWDVCVWLVGKAGPFRIAGVSGEGWAAMTDCLGNRILFLFVTDRDGGEVVVRTDDIDLLTGLKVSRDKKLEVAMNDVSSEE